MDYDKKMQDISYDLSQDDYIQRVKIGVELVDGIKLSIETTKPNKEK